MKLELKKIKIGPGSEETTQFTAELYVNGKLAAHCDNSGKGGCTDIRAYEPGQRELVAQAEAFCKTLPPVKSSFGGEYPMDLEGWVDEQVYKAESEKEIKRVLNKFDRKTANHIIVISKKLLDDFKSGKAVELSYREWKLNTPIALLNEGHKRAYVLDITGKLKGDEYIYNSNLPK